MKPPKNINGFLYSWFNSPPFYKLTEINKKVRLNLEQKCTYLVTLQWKSEVKLFMFVFTQVKILFFLLGTNKGH